MTFLQNVTESSNFDIYQKSYTRPFLNSIQQYHINVTLPSIQHQKEKGQKYPSFLLMYSFTLSSNAEGFLRLKISNCEVKKQGFTYCIVLNKKGVTSHEEDL